jgi:hypothetical protein
MTACAARRDVNWSRSVRKFGALRRRCAFAALVGVATAGAWVAPAGATPVSIEAPATFDCAIAPDVAAQCASGSVAVGIVPHKVQVCSDACQWITTPKPSRGLLQFGLGVVPAGSDVLSASVRVWVSTRGSASLLPIEVRPLVNRWTNAATWNDYDTFSPWVAAGGDVGSPVTSGSIAGQGQYYRFDVTGLAREWVAGVRPNFGLVLKRAVEGGVVQSDAASVRSTEGTSPGLPPVIELTYESGTPPGVGLSGSLWDERDVELSGDRSDAGYIDSDESLHVSASEGALGAGVASIEMLVDGQRLRPEHIVSTGGAATASADFTLRRADITAGDHEIRVYVRDAHAPADSSTPGAHVAVRSFVISAGNVVATDDGDYEDVPPPGSGEPAQPFRGTAASSLLSLAAASDTRTLVAAQATLPDSDLARLLSGTRFEIEELGTMSRGADAAGNPRIVGSVAVLKLAQPQIVDTTIDCYRARADGATTTPYRARVRATALRDLFVRLDLARGALLCASPGPTSEADVQAVPGQSPLPAPSED